MDFLNRIDESKNLHRLIIALLTLAVLGLLFVVGTTKKQNKENTGDMQGTSLQQINKHKHQKCANKLLDEPITAKILADLKANDGRLRHFSTAQQSTVAGFSSNGEQLAVVRKSSCIVVINANNKFAEILVGPVVRMPLGH
jgi:hypothetical protein